MIQKHLRITEIQDEKLKILAEMLGVSENTIFKLALEMYYKNKNKNI